MRLVYGLGRSGLGVLRFLRKRGLPARFYDDRPREEEVREALALGFQPDWNIPTLGRRCRAASLGPLER